MPTYEYACKACGHQFEEWQSITADPIKKCPSCGKKKVERLLGTGGAIIFKGSGFYITDYRSESYKKGEKADSPTSAKSDSGEGKSGSGESTKSDSTAKTESKAEKPATPKADKPASKPKKD